MFVNRCTAPPHVRGSDIAGATMASQTYLCRDLGSTEQSLPAKRYWGFLGEDPGAEHHTLADSLFNTDFHDFDWQHQPRGRAQPHDADRPARPRELQEPDMLRSEAARGLSGRGARPMRRASSSVA